MTKLLEATGFIGGGSSAEVINLDDSKPNLICDNLPNLPMSLHVSVGQLFRGTTPMICGGYSSQYEKRCHSLENGAWKAISSLNINRYAASAVTLSPTGNTKDDIFLVATGSNDGQTQSTVETFDGVSWNQNSFPKLPFPLLGNCILKLNNSVLMSIGGSKLHNVADSTSETNVFNLIQNNWVAGPMLASPRMWHSCGVMNWKNDSTGIFEKVVVVSGGYDKQGSQLNSVELLFINDFERYNSGWKVGPNSPVRVDGSAMIEFQNGVIMIGGRGEGDGRRLFKLTSPYGNWTEMKQTLKEPRSHFVSFLVPDELVSCH
jgi:hypothetical protein